MSTVSKREKTGGRPKFNRFVRHIEEMGGEEWALGLIADGMTISRFMKENGTGLSRQQFYLWVNQTEERREAFRAARKQAAEAYADDALDIIDGAEETSAAVSKAKEQVGVRKWLAAVADPDKYGKATDEGQGASVLHLHLHALQQLGKPVQRALPEPAIEEGEVEVVEDADISKLL